AYQKVIRDFYDAGCRNLQFDDCSWGLCLSDEENGNKEVNDYIKVTMEQLLTVNNLALENKPEDMIVTTHVCRGNYRSTFFSSGVYDPVAETLFVRENVDAYYLEYDDERSGGFEPLKYVPENKKVVLGLITTKSPVLEDKNEVIARIHEAAKYVPLDRL